MGDSVMAICIFMYGWCETTVEQINNTTGTVSYLHHDQAGSTRLITGESGKVEGKCSYSAYGTPTCEGSATTPLGYDGQYTSSDTGLIYMRAREYDPATAQFLSRDPLAAISGQPYAYADDNPLSVGDPSGLLFGITLPSLEEVGESIAGWGDTITLGATKLVREQIGDENVDTCSAAYQSGGVAGLVTGVLIPGEGEAEIGAEGLEETLAGLREGHNAGVYEVDNAEELQSIYDELSAGGKPTNSTYPGQEVELPNGTRVGIRETSKTGGPTVDINTGSARYRIHVAE